MYCCLQEISAIPFNTIEYRNFSIPISTEKYQKIPKIPTGNKKKSQKIKDFFW